MLPRRHEAFTSTHSYCHMSKCIKARNWEISSMFMHVFVAPHAITCACQHMNAAYGKQRRINK